MGGEANEFLSGDNAENLFVNVYTSSDRNAFPGTYTFTYGQPFNLELVLATVTGTGLAVVTPGVGFGFNTEFTAAAE